MEVSGQLHTSAGLGYPRNRRMGGFHRRYKRVEKKFVALVGNRTLIPRSYSPKSLSLYLQCMHISPCTWQSINQSLNINQIHTIKAQTSFLDGRHVLNFLRAVVNMRIFGVFLFSLTYRCRYQRPRGLRRGSAGARLLRLWVRIPPGGMDVCLLWMLCVVR